MSAAIAFDTHQFVKRLTEHGFTERQAEALANEQVALLNGNLATKADVAAIQRDIEVLRQKTKADIEALRQETKAEIAAIQRDIEALRQGTRTDIAAIQRDIEALRQETRAGIEALRQGTRADIANLKADLLKWMFGALIAQGGLIVALVKLL